MAQLPGAALKPNRLQRHCLVTIGATAGFPQLLDEVASLDFLKYMNHKGYTHLHVQCGNGRESFSDAISKLEIPTGLSVQPFAFVDNLTEVMVLCRAEPLVREYGVIITHGGTGTILDAWRIRTPFIVVPNPTLKDNHQEELAEELQRQGYAIAGHLGNLTAAVDEVDRLREEQYHRWRPNSADEAPAKVTLWGAGDALTARYMSAAQIAAANSPGQPPSIQPGDEVVKEEATRMTLD